MLQGLGSQAISYTTGVPAMIGTMMVAKGCGRSPASSPWRSLTPIPIWKRSISGSSLGGGRAPSAGGVMELLTIPTPSYVIDRAKLEENCRILAGVMERTGCKILLAQKAFSAFSQYPLIGRYLSGTTASGLFEARLGREEMGKENHVFSPAYRDGEFDEIVSLCDHIVFNSASQLRKFKPRCKDRSVGLRITPQCSTQEHAIYDPCAPGSRLGATRIRLTNLTLLW